MNCQDVDRIMIDLAHGAATDEVALAHIEGCPSCGERLLEERRLSAGLAAWSRTSIGEQAPPFVEANLLQAFRRETQARYRSKWVPFAAVGSIAATVLLFRLFTIENPVAPAMKTPHEPRIVSVLPVPLEPAPVAPPVKRIRRVQRSIEPARDPEPAEAHFLPVAQGDGWTPLDGGRVVRVKLPRSALLVFGLPMNEERAFEQVQADVMLSNDGLLRAIRFVQ